MAGKKGTALMMVWADIPADKEADFNKWYNEEHMAELLSVPGVLNAEDLTGAAVYFASDEARFITGQVLVIDGGKHMPG